MLPLQSVEILRKLDKKELKRFGDFLSSPYFNNSDLILRIFDAVKKEHPEFDGKFLQSEKIFKKLYPGEEFKETRIQNLYSEFGGLLKKFMGYERIESKKSELDIFIAEALTKRDLNDISNKIILRSLSSYEDGSLYIPNSFVRLHRLNQNYLHNLDSLRQQDTEEYLNIQINGQKNLLIFFLTSFLEMCLTNSINNRLFDWKKNKIESFLEAINFEKVLEYIGDNFPEYKTFIKTIYLIYYYTEHPITPEQYYELKSGVLEIMDKVHRNDKLFFIVRTIQIILAKLVQIDRRTFYREIFELSKIFSEQQIFPNEVLKNLAIGPFRDMFTVAIILNEYDWAENFVNEYSQYLNEEKRENELNYSMGVLSFKRNDFEASLSYFNKLQLHDIIEKVNVRFYYMMNYIELKAYESALASLNTIRQFYTDRAEEIPEMFAVLIPNALKYFGIVIKAEEKDEKIERYLIDEAKKSGRFYHVKYVLDKMEKRAG
ncbi:MAG: hypothetical protein JST55_14260 [Bacteroidetes bacterium]|nr:hypothetical protein [Bacteroidota bacterium]